MRHWPLLDLRLVTPRLELRPATLDDLDRLADRSLEGVHAPGDMPFGFPWTAAPAADLPRNTIRFHLGALAAWRPDEWHAPFAVVHEGETVGVQSLRASEFATTREVGTGSWLGLAWQGKGIGTEMRAAVLHLAFRGLGAETATSSAFVDNPASLAVSRKLGYRPDGLDVCAIQGRRRVNQRLRLMRAEFACPVAVEVHGLEACLADFGAGPG
ncbi:GNAT family protein [Nonomuraea longicatena]|uniref:GNAT family protein n=1 Tax=Nonomuraea longicatena TaxID=83682 RepID=A0ABN1Q4B1_9ACTN